MHFSELSVGSTRDVEDIQTHVCVAQGGRHLFLQKQTLPLSFNDNLSIFKESWRETSRILTYILPIGFAQTRKQKYLLLIHHVRVNV